MSSPRVSSPRMEAMKMASYPWIDYRKHTQVTFTLQCGYSLYHTLVPEHGLDVANPVVWIGEVRVKVAEPI